MSDFKQIIIDFEQGRPCSFRIKRKGSPVNEVIPYAGAVKNWISYRIEGYFEADDQENS